ncbi:uncharacterized protein LOC129588977 [Paramacrobiotus metropolitanus]|uniref:uncharacterized protein LOC129588977 n=1 Tax=Paramacrobiotus metropolitanus TaxID=2943436 RepID=UPI002446017C|nr:uncharacterized protein LOC129588977 [Paramacrobiotus metropolitanus]
MILVIRNVTMRSGGFVQCVIDPSTTRPIWYSTHRHILQLFLVLPRVTHRSEVFAAPGARYVIATEGETVTLQCGIRLPISERVHRSLENHVMWIHNGRIVQGLWEGPYGLPWFTSGRIESDHSEFTNSPGQLGYARLHFRAVQLSDGGYIQCLFRPHQDIHEWIVQSMTLLVFPKNTTQ